jgi:hypothetical protein
MKRLLVVAYYFPPSGGPGVQRVLKYVKYLPQFGWDPVVLTVENGEFPAVDESLLKEVPPAVPVYRTKIYEPYGIYRAITGRKKGTPVDVNVIRRAGEKRGMAEAFADMVRATIFIPDARIGWLVTAVRAGEGIVRREKIDAIYSSSPPHTCSVIARGIKRRTKKPWVAGFRDPWSGFENTAKRWFIPRKIDEALEGSVANEADRIEVAWLGIRADFLAKHPEVRPEKFVHIPNGFDSADFPARSNERNEKFTVVYTGSLYGTRNPADFLQAVEGLAAAGTLDPANVRLKFVGRFGDEVKAMLQASPIRDCIEVVTYAPHKESIAALVAADATLLIVDEIAGSEEVVPGKVYEYLGAGRPIIALAPPDGAIASLLRETGAGRIAPRQDIPAISKIVLQYYSAFLTGTAAVHPDSAAIARYERRSQAGSLATVLDELTT